MIFDSLDDEEKKSIIKECEGLIDSDQRSMISDRYPDYAQAIIDQIEGVEGSRRTFALSKEAETGWFDDSSDGIRWEIYRDYLLSKNESPDDIWTSITEVIDRSTTRLMNFLEDPQSESFARRVRGLVVGHVQSGKTANFTGLVSKAADSGYNVIIILAGITNSLRNQTQSRMFNDLKINSEYIFNEPKAQWESSDEHWIPMTRENIIDDKISTTGQIKKIEKSMDFGSSPLSLSNLPFGGSIQSLLGVGKPMLIVTKKRAARLELLRDWITDCPEDLRSHLKILIIDDESDAASVNNMRPTHATPSQANDPIEVDEDEATVINSSIRRILHVMPNSGYVGYTATPYASLFSAPLEDSSDLGLSLFPRDFVLTLPKPSNHDGTREFFGEEGRLRSQVSIIKNREAMRSRTPPEFRAGENNLGKMPVLMDSIVDFFITGAIKRMRGFGEQHHSMLVHTSILTPPHRNLAKGIRSFSTLIKSAYMADNWGSRTKIYDSCKKRWEDQFNISEDQESEMDKHMKRFLNEFDPATMVRKINSKPPDSEELIQSKNKLDYEDVPGGLKVIAVGGTILSRGLTVEGLTISYFTRETALYDTLTQMSRWCGFHEGWDDLIRVRISSRIKDWYEWINEVETALRSDIWRYDSDPEITPLDLAPRVLAHQKTMPDDTDERVMDPTRRSAMWNATSYSRGLNGTYKQTFNFHINDKSILSNNLKQTREFIRCLIADPNVSEFSTLTSGSPGSVIWKQVPLDHVVTFLENYDSADENFEFEYDIRPYIDRRGDELFEWSIVLINNSLPRMEKEKLFKDEGLDFEFGLIERGRKQNGRIDQLISKNNTAIDLPGFPQDYRGGKVRERAMRDRPMNQPLLLVYVMHKDSKPRDPDSSNYVDLFDGIASGEREHVVGLGLALPDSTSVTQDERREYYHARGLTPE